MCCECGDCSHFSAWQYPVLLFSTDRYTDSSLFSESLLSVKVNSSSEKVSISVARPCSCTNLMLLLAAKHFGVNAETHHWYETLMFW